MVDKNDQENVDEELIDEEQLEEYREKVLELGRFADKVAINSLSMIAEDYAGSEKSAAAIYNCIREPLISSSVSSDRKLPLVYVIDSILKNVRGAFIPVIEKDAKLWIPIVYGVLNEENRARLKKVWNTWKEFNVFLDNSWREMGICFTNSETGGIKLVAGILRSKDGSLQIPAPLRREMQNVLDDLQSDVTNELEKVSLERLADINPDLLQNIKQTAEDVLRGGSRGGPGNNEGCGTSSLFEETRSQSTIQRSKDWEKLNLNHVKHANEMISKLQLAVQEGASSHENYIFLDAFDLTSALASAAVTSALLSSALERLKNQDENKENRMLTFPESNISNFYQVGSGRGLLSVDKAQFTNDGIKKKNDGVIGVLYGVGLPFVSSSDGRRFASQFELSSHLDALFKRSQMEKSMTKTEERGWYVPDVAWTLESTSVQQTTSLGDPVRASESKTDEDADPSTFTVPADESRDRCVICGINFRMFFDNDDGIYKYSSCREMEVLNDDVAEEESEMALVHVTCWRGLGSPPFLSRDQALQETRH